MTEEIKEVEKWYQKTWVIVLMLIFLAPVGIIVMWVQNKFTKRTRIIVTVVLGFLILVGVQGNNSPQPTNTEKIKPTTAAVDSDKKDPEAEKKSAEYEAKKESEAKAQAEKEAKNEAARIAAEKKQAQDEVKNYKASAKKISYKKLARDPDKYLYQPISYKGKVIQVMEDGSTVALRVNITKGSYDIWQDTMLVTYELKPGASRILEDDIIQFWGDFAGLESYQAVLGNEVTIPKVEARYLSVLSK